MIIPENIQKLIHRYDELNSQRKGIADEMNEIRPQLIDFMKNHTDIEFQSENYKYVISETKVYEYPESITLIEKELKKELDTLDQKKKQSILSGESKIVAEGHAMRVLPLTK